MSGLGITFLFRFGHAVCLTAIPFLTACCGSQHSSGHAGRMAWTSWIINMIFRAVVMETQAVPHIWIIRIRHILNITFNQKRWLSPKDKSILPNSSSSMQWIWAYLYVCFEEYETNPCFIIHYFCKTPCVVTLEEKKWSLVAVSSSYKLC